MKDQELIQIGKETIKIEADTLSQLNLTIGQEFCDAVRMIAESKGRLIVSGIGKSALIAQKIVATLNSTGTPSIFMHAADAIHGDLGMIQADDIVLCISKSGESPEIKVLIPSVHHLGNKVIAMTASKKSTLAVQADLLLYTPIDQEGDPNNLAPTASTTCQMALGDALATSLLALKGFTKDQFAKFHPGGSLGKQLYLRVHHLHTQNACPKVMADSNLRECILEMTSKRLGATAVVNEKDELLGIITDGDLRRMLEQNKQAENVTASQIMSSHPKSVSPDTLAVEAMALMRKFSISQLVVAKKNKLVGFIHIHDLIREGLV